MRAARISRRAARDDGEGIREDGGDITSAGNLHTVTAHGRAGQLADALLGGEAQVERLGFKPKLGRHVGARLGFLAGDDRARAEEQTKSNQRLRQRAIYLTIAFIVAGALALAAIVFGQRSIQAEHLATSRELAAAGWVELGTARYRPERIERIAIPLAAEPGWCAAFGFVPLPAAAWTALEAEFPEGCCRHLRPIAVKPNLFTDPLPPKHSARSPRTSGPTTRRCACAWVCILVNP